MSKNAFKRGLLYGQATGFFYFLLALCFFWPGEELFLIKSSLLKLHIFIFSLSFWALFFTCLITILIFISSKIRPGTLDTLKNVLNSTVIFFFVYLGYGTYLHYEYNLPPHFPSYLLKREILTVVLTIAAVSAFSGIAVALLTQVLNKILRLKRLNDIYHRLLYKFPLFSFLFLLFYFVSTSFIGHLSTRKTILQADKKTGNKIIILGLDAASWNILAPLLQEGSLKNIEKLLKNPPCGSSYGYLDTYGEQFTPPVWASIVTGKKREKHAINSFSNSTYDWRAKPIWEILSDHGEKVGVVNWMNTYPAVPVNGFMFSKIQRKLPDQFELKYKEDFEIPVEQLFVPDEMAQGKDYKLDLRKSFSNEVENLRELISYLKNFQSYKLILLYNYRIDSIHHFFWSDFENERLKKSLSSGKSEELNNDVVADSWQELDNLIGELLDKMDEDTILCVLSDHGSRKIHRQEIVLDIEKILKELNDSFLIQRDTSHAVINILDEETVEVLKNVSDREFIALVSDLKNIKFWPSQKPIFQDIKTKDYGMSRIIKLQLTRDLKILPKKIKIIRIKEALFPLEDFIDIHPWSGRHRARGIILVYGKSIINRYLGAWLVDSPYFYIFRLLHGRTPHLDRVYPLLKFLHLVDPVTTLDLTPTLLSMLGYPKARDMDGKDVSSLIIPRSQNLPMPIESYGKSNYYDEKREPDREELKRIRDELRALGYVK